MQWSLLIHDYTFQNVIIGASLLGLISGALGTFAVLRRQSLLGDAISHAALPGVCLGFIISGGRSMGGIMLGALVTGALAALVMLALTRMSRLKTDAALGICLSVFFAVGIVLLTYLQGTNNASQGGLEAFLFGQAAATLRSDLWLMGSITLGALIVLTVLWKQVKLVTFDPEYARTLGIPATLIESLLTVMVTLAVVVGLQMVGVVLMAAMIVAPAAAARQWSHQLGAMVVIAAGIGVASGITGATISTLSRGLATGPLIILTASAFVIVSLTFAPQRGLLWGIVKHYRQKWVLHKQQILYTLYKCQITDTPAQMHAPIKGYFWPNIVLLGLYREGFLVRKERGVAYSGWSLTQAGTAEARRLKAVLEGKAQ